MSNILWNLKRVRELKGMTPTELGKWCGFDDKTSYVRIADYEKFKRKPKDDQLEELAHILGVIPEVLLSAPRLDINELFAWRLLEMSEQLEMDVQEDRIIFKDLFFKKFLKEWKDMNEAYMQKKITEEEYYKWKIKRRL